MSKIRVPAILALVTTIGFFAVLIFLLMHEGDVPSNQVINTLVGSLATAWAMVVSYYFGSSMGSERKTEILADHHKHENP